MDLNWQIIATILRYMFSALGVYLISKGILTQEQSDSLAPILERLLGAIIALIPILLAIREKFRQKDQLETALNMPEFSTKEDLKKQLKGRAKK